jgi:hypothetical protein
METHYTTQISSFASIIDKLEEEVTELTKKNESLSRQLECRNSHIKKEVFLNEANAEPEKPRLFFRTITNDFANEDQSPLISSPCEMRNHGSQSNGELLRPSSELNLGDGSSPRMTPPVSPQHFRHPVVGNAQLLHQIYIVSFELLMGYSKAIGFDCSKQSSTMIPALTIRKFARKSKEISNLSSLSFIELFHKMQTLVHDQNGNINFSDIRNLEGHSRPIRVTLDDLEWSLSEEYNAKTSSFSKIFKNTKWFPFPSWILCGLLFVFRWIQLLYFFFKTNLCMPNVCSEMAAGPNLIYKYTDSRSTQTVSACEYFELLSKFILGLPVSSNWEKALLNHTVNPLPLNLVSDLHFGTKMLFRYLNHLYYSHGGAFLLVEEHRSLKKFSGQSPSCMFLE